MAAVANNCCSLAYATASFGADKEVVMTTVANVGWMLRYVSDNLKDDRDVW